MPKHAARITEVPGYRDTTNRTLVIGTILAFASIVGYVVVLAVL
jgi:hypothetical protein